MTLDGRYPDLDLFLHRVRRGLNLRFLAGEALAAAAVAAPLALVPAFLVPAPLPLALVWASVTAAVPLVWTAWKFRCRLSLGQAASWLDEAKGTRGLFRAASDALDRDPSVFPDEINLKAADLERMVTRRARYPWRRLGLRLGLATASVLAAFAVAALPLPFGWSTRVGTPVAPPAAAGPGAQASPEAGKGQAVSPQEAARRLFPENQRLAALAEQALASGDIGALQSLMDQNPGQASPAERQKLGRSAPKRPPLSGPRGPGGEPGSGENGDPGTEGGDGTPGKSSGPSDNSGQPGGQGREGASKGSSGTKDQDPSSAEGTTGGTGTPGDPAEAGNGRDGGNNPQLHGVNPGTNHSDEKLGARGPLPGGTRRLVIPEKGQPGVYEYVLPETGAQVPLSQALADTSRTAEAALDRTSAPMEYENTVREYFLMLSQEAKP